jgi:hypothetical protein
MYSFYDDISVLFVLRSFLVFFSVIFFVYIPVLPVRIPCLPFWHQVTAWLFLCGRHSEGVSNPSKAARCRLSGVFPLLLPPPLLSNTANAKYL